MPDSQPEILDWFVDDEGFVHVTDTEGVTILPPQATQYAGSTFGVGVDWYGGSAEIRWWADDDGGNNRSLVHVQLFAHTSGFVTYGNGSFLMRAAGDSWSGWYTEIGGGWTHIASRDVWVGHDAAGAMNLELGVVTGEVQGTSFNNVSGTQWHGLTNYVVLPYAPQNLRVVNVATTSFGVYYDLNSHDGRDRPDHAQWATDANFSNIVWDDNGPQGYTSPANGAGPALAPGTRHWVRVQSHTARGWGPYSASVSQVTLPAVAPGLAVATTPSGASAVLKFTPPGGVTGVTSYDYEYRVKSPVGTVTKKSTPSTTVTQGGLTPGETYEWRASAWIGNYQSPWTGWQSLTQARPNTNPGDYFDGNTEDTSDVDYGWTGTPGGSTSTVTGQNVAGWSVVFDQGAAGAMYRAAGGMDVNGGAYAARVQFMVDATAAGAVRAGLSTSHAADVTQGGVYVGSIHARVSRAQRLIASIWWLNDALAEVGTRSYGTAVLVPTGQWVRLSAQGVAPAGATHAIIRITDTAGDGWALWRAGDAVRLDGMMLSLDELFPYFDGATLSDETYEYEWTDPALPHQSTSKRTLVAQGGASAIDGPRLSARAILDPNCIPPSPPRPPTIPNDCITEAGIWRRTLAIIPAAQISDWLDVVPTFEIVTQSQNVEQVRIRIYANPDNVTPDLVDTSTWVSEQIVAFVPSHTLLTIDGMRQRVYAEVGGRAAISADHLLYGSNGTVPNWPVLSCGIPYVLSVDLPVEIEQGGSKVNAYVTTRY